MRYVFTMKHMKAMKIEESGISPTTKNKQPTTAA
jgi:hypothetical protein